MVLLAVPLVVHWVCFSFGVPLVLLGVPLVLLGSFGVPLVLLGSGTQAQILEPRPPYCLEFV